MQKFKNAFIALALTLVLFVIVFGTVFLFIFLVETGASEELIIAALIWSFIGLPVVMQKIL